MKFALMTGLAILVVIGAGCERYVPVSGPTEPPPEELAVPEFTSISASSGSLHLEWTVASDSNLSYYRVYHAVGPEGTFLAADSTTTDHIVISGLAMNQAHRFAVAAVSRRGIEGYWSRIVTLQPARMGTIPNPDRRSGK